MVLTLTLPTPTLGGPPAHAPGLYLLRGNASPADFKRRKLVLGEGDLLAAVEPRFERRISIELGTPRRMLPWISRLADQKAFWGSMML